MCYVCFVGGVVNVGNDDMDVLFGELFGNGKVDVLCSVSDYCYVFV